MMMGRIIDRYCTWFRTNIHLLELGRLELGRSVFYQNLFDPLFNFQELVSKKLCLNHMLQINSYLIEQKYR